MRALLEGAPAALAADKLRVARYKRLALWWIASRAAVVAVAIYVHVTARPSSTFGELVHRHALGLLQTWDAGWYTRTAEYGYLLIPHRNGNPAFFPLYPILLRAGHALGVTDSTAGLVISNVSFLLAVVALYELGRELLPEKTAYRAAALAAIFPMSFVFSMVYPEALALLAICAAGVWAFRGHWVPAALAAAVAALTRPEGVLLVLPLSVLAWRRRATLTPDELGRAAAAALAAPVAFLTYPLYLGWSLHNFFAWQQAEAAWHRSFRSDGIARAFVDLPTQLHAHPWLYRDVALLPVYLALLVVAAHARVPWEWIGFGALVVCLPLATGWVRSDARFGLLAVPVYWGLAHGARRPVVILVSAVSFVLLIVGTLTIRRAIP